MMILSYAPLGAETATKDGETTTRKPGWNADVEKLQKALKILATKTGNSAFDPGEADGVVNESTANALGAVLPKLGGYINKYLATTLEVAILVGYAIEKEKIEKTIKEKASEFQKAVVAYTAALVLASSGGGSSKAPSSGGTRAPIRYGTFVLPPPGGGGGALAPSTTAKKPWYSEPWGMAAIGVGAVGFLSLVIVLARR